MSKYIVCQYITQTHTNRFLVEADNPEDASRLKDEDDLYEKEITSVEIDGPDYIEKTFDDAFISEDEYDNRQLNIPESIEERSGE